MSMADNTGTHAIAILLGQPQHLNGQCVLLYIYTQRSERRFIRGTITRAFDIPVTSTCLLSSLLGGPGLDDMAT